MGGNSKSVAEGNTEQRKESIQTTLYSAVYNNFVDRVAQSV
jgi:hypothetical protein